MPVHHVHSEEEFKTVTSKGNGDKVLLVDFSAEWCGPCKMIAPAFESLSNTYSNSNFLFIHVDVDEMSDFAQNASIKAMPTFVFYKNTTSTELARIRGADASALEAKIKELSSQYKPFFQGEGNKLGGSGPTPTATSSGSASGLSADEIIQIAQSNVEYSLSSCCRVGFRFQPAIEGGVLSGAKPFLRINGGDKVSKLRAFIDSLLDLSAVSTRSYELRNAYPPGKLDEDQTINESSVAGAVVVVKFT